MICHRAFNTYITNTICKTFFSFLKIITAEVIAIYLYYLLLIPHSTTYLILYINEEIYELINIDGH